MSDDLTIGVLAKRSGVNVETIRCYQRRQLLEEPSKPLGLLDLDERKACLKTREIAVQKLASIEEKLSDLLRMKKALSRLVRACDASSVGQPCPIIHLLVRD